jgi:hypothetical protein
MFWTYFLLNVFLCLSLSQTKKLKHLADGLE